MKDVGNGSLSGEEKCLYERRKIYESWKIS